MLAEIKTFLWAERQTLLTIVILILVSLAAFQLGRLSLFYARPSDFNVQTIP
jgi:hypothetical protein